MAVRVVAAALFLLPPVIARGRLSGSTVILAGTALATGIVHRLGRARRLMHRGPAPA